MTGYFCKDFNYMNNISPEAVRCIWTGAVIIVNSFICRLTGTGLRNITTADISRFYRYHPHTAAHLDYFSKRPLLTAVTIDTLQYAGLFGGGSTLLPVLVHMDLLMLRLFIAGFALLFIFFGTMLPRSLGIRFREPVAFIFIHPFALISRILIPITWPLATIGTLIGKPKPYTPEQITNDLKVLARTAANEKAISAQQAHLITRSVELSDITAADIMVKRADIKPISDTASLSEALIEAHLHHHTRFPLVHDNDIDQIIGYVNFKDIVGALRINPADPSLNGIKRPLESVPFSMPLPELLQQLTRGFQHMVIVTDHTHSTLGIVTLEDLMETLVGNLEDEYDNPPEYIIQLTEKRFCAGGGTRFSQLHKKISEAIPDWDITIAEWMTGNTKGTIPDQFSTVYQQCTFTVRKVARDKVFDVLIERESAS